MSQRALLLAVRDVLQAASPGGLGLAADQCDVLFDGQPPPGCGPIYVAVHPGEWTASDVEGLKESFGFDITVTVRIAVLPRAKQGPVSTLAGIGGKDLDTWLEKIRALLHLDEAADQVLAKANQYITTQLGASNGFVEPPRFKGSSRPQPRGPEWFQSEMDVKGKLPPVGVSQTLTFGGAVRVQTVESED